METLQLRKKTKLLFGFNITSLKKLTGYDNDNYRVVCKGNKYILKKYSYSKKNESIINEYVNHLENKIIQNPGDWLWSHKRWKLTK